MSRWLELSKASLSNSIGGAWHSPRHYADGMECALVLLMLVSLVCLLPLFRMLLGTGPNGFRRLVRLDLGAFFVMTAGVALALGVTSAITWREGRLAAGIVLLVLLRAGLAASRFGRFLV